MRPSDPFSSSVAASPAPDAPAAMARHLAEVATAAGEIALSMFRADVETWTKSNDSPVTAADLAVDAYLRERLQALAPDYGWLSEESADSPDRLSRRRVWVVDPIDGTRGFMAGGSDWSISAALVEDGRPIAGALFAPVTNELFLASLGGGATRNGAPIAASQRAGLDGATVAGPNGALDAMERRARIQRVPRARSLALRLARVATGELDLTLAGAAANDWDIAAADLIVHEACGAVTSYDGAVPRYNAPSPRHRPLVCAGLNLHGPVLALLKGGAGL